MKKLTKKEIVLNKQKRGESNLKNREKYKN